jgi:GTP-binding protein Era
MRKSSSSAKDSLQLRSRYRGIQEEETIITYDIIYVERNSQKGIIISQGGEALKVGTWAEEMEVFPEKVFLE